MCLARRARTRCGFPRFRAHPWFQGRLQGERLTYPPFLACCLVEGWATVVFGSGSVQRSAAPPYGRTGTPWWYRYVRSWRLRMWIETGIWDRDLEPAPRGPAR